MTLNQENTVRLEGEIAELQKRVDEAQEALEQWEAKRKQESLVVSVGDPTLRFTIVSPKATAIWSL